MNDQISSNLLETWLEHGIGAALEAGQAISSIYHRGFSVTLKKDQSPLTEADAAAHEIIKSRLSGTDLPLISEEGKEIPFEKRKAWRLVWIVDPLDGTREFISMNGEFTVNIALVKDSVPVMGIIFAPELDLLYFSSAGQGAYCLQKADPRRLSGIPPEALRSMADKLPRVRDEKKLTIVGSRSHMNEATTDFIEKIKASGKETMFISRGSSLKFCALADGSAGLYPRFGPTMEWDTAAGHAILMESGGTCTLADTGMPLVYNKPDLLNPFFIARGAGQ